MNKKIKYTLASTLLVLGISSCDSFLSEMPDDRTVIESTDAVKELLVSAYPSGTYMPFCETMSDNAADKGEASGKADLIKNTQSYFWEEHSSLTQDSYNYFWTTSYDAIAAANHALEAIEEMGDNDALKPYKGEALVARAYNHFMLANVFSEHYDPSYNGERLGIPYNLAPEKKVFVDYKRETLEKTYELIRQDLEEGLPLIESSAYDVKAYHFNQDAAYAFASRFYLYIGEWEKAIACADKVLVGDYENKIRKWNTDYVSYDYYTLEAQYSKADEASNLLLASVMTVYPRYFAGYRYGLTKPDYMRWYYNDRPASGGSWAYKIFGGEYYGNIPKFKEHFKLASINATTGWIYIMATLFTVEEVLFNRAEAHVMLDNYGAAMDDVNTFYAHRITDYNPSTHSVTPEKFEQYYANPRLELPELTPFYAMSEKQKVFVGGINELRRKEFIQEGMRWFDVKRFHIEVTRMQYESEEIIDVLTSDDLRRAVQIPEDALSYGIEPNPRNK